LRRRSRANATESRTTLNAFSKRHEKLDQHRRHVGISRKPHARLLMESNSIAERHGNEFGSP
jgi:hypothetical protein